MESGGYHYQFNKEQVQREKGKMAEDSMPKSPRRSKRKRKPKQNDNPKERKRRAFADDEIDSMSLQCCLKTCLLDLARVDRKHIKNLRRPYNRKPNWIQKANHLYSKMDVQFHDEEGKRNRVKYRVRDQNRKTVVICRTAFRKIYGVSEKTLKNLLKKVDPDTDEIEIDLRSLQRNQRKLPVNLKTEVSYLIVILQ